MSSRETISPIYEIVHPELVQAEGGERKVGLGVEDRTGELSD